MASDTEAPLAPPSQQGVIDVVDPCDVLWDIHMVLIFGII